MTELKPCPWETENETCKLEIIVTDDEGNWQGNPGCEYEKNPWSGGPWYQIEHKGDCPCGEFSFGRFSSLEELIEAWNTRAERTCEIARVETGEPAEYDCDEVLWHCASCHEEVAIYAYNENGDTWADKPAFCPNCGAKVVE